MRAQGDIDDLRRAGVIAVIRAPEAELAVRAVKAIVSGGITGIEITFTTPDAREVIAALDAEYGDAIVLGAGTVLDITQADQAIEAGARFLVTPGTDREILARAHARNTTIIPGVLSPTEIMAAVRMGAGAVKLFPASLGGQAYLKSLRGPFPDVSFIPTGGVSAAGLAGWFAAGAFAVGAGSELCSRELLRAGDWAAVTSRAADYQSALSQIRVPHA